MFKAKVIHDKKYYQYQYFQFIVFALTIVPIGLFSNSLFGLPEWITIPAGVVYILLMVLLFRNQKKMNNAFGKKTVVATIEAIEIHSKKEGLLKKYVLNEADKIEVMKTYPMEVGGLSDVIEQFKGNFPKSYFRFKTQEDTKKIEFILESHYQLIQLEKCIKNWKEKGLTVKEN